MSPGRKISLLLFSIICGCIPPQTPTISGTLNSTRPIPVLVDETISLQEVSDAVNWINQQVGDDIFVISSQQPTRDFSDEPVFVPYSTTISVDDLGNNLAGENVVTTQSQTHVFMGSRILINSIILHDHEKLQVTLRHELLHDFLHDIDCSTIQSRDIMCGNGPFRLNAVLSKEEKDWILAN